MFGEEKKTTRRTAKRGKIEKKKKSIFPLLKLKLRNSPSTVCWSGSFFSQILLPSTFAKAGKIFIEWKIHEQPF